VSEAFYVAGDLVFPRGKLRGWRRAALDADAGREPPKGISPLQPHGLRTVTQLEAFLQRGPPFELAFDRDRMRLRVGITDHDLHDCGGALDEAFRLAVRLGATGELVIASDGAGPTVAYRFTIGTDGGLVRLAPKAARELTRSHAGLAEIRDVIERTFIRTDARGTAPPGKKRTHAKRPQTTSAPLASLDGAELMRAFGERLALEPDGVYDEVSALLAASSPLHERFLHATCHVLGQNLVVYGVKPRQRAAKRVFTADVLRVAPRWGDLLARWLADPHVHAHFREHAFAALAATRDRRWERLLLEHVLVADAATIANAARGFGEPFAKKILSRLATLDRERGEEVEVWLDG
jgi:hypothetical protein